MIVVLTAFVCQVNNYSEYSFVTDYFYFKYNNITSLVHAR